MDRLTAMAVTFCPPIPSSASSLVQESFLLWYMYTDLGCSDPPTTTKVSLKATLSASLMPGAKSLAGKSYH